MKQILNYIKVNEYIATSGQPTKKQFKLIAKEGFDVVINLAMHNKGALKKEDKIVSKAGMMYIHIPITWENPELERFEMFLHLLKTLEKENKKVFIHCIMNYRASAFLYQYKRLVWKEVNAELIAPKEFKPKKVWRKLMEMELSI